MPRRKRDRAMPALGSVRERSFKGRVYHMTVVAGADGVAYRVGKRDFRTPSGAAKSVTGNEVNGWQFWGLE